jgi:cobalt-zinc-cadmium resistance protein CzcA
VIEALIRFALRQRLFVLGGVLTLIVVGLLAVQRVPFDAFPDLTGTRVEVITPAPGMSPADVERLVTYPLESVLMGIPRSEGVRSVSKNGLSLITVSFPDAVDVYFARTVVQQRLGDAMEALPPGVEPGLGPITTPMGELYQYTLTSDSMSLTDLTTLHDYVIRPRLRTVPGVSEINSWGGLTEQIEIVVDAAALAARGLTLGDVHRALDENNRLFGASFLEQGGERYAIRGLARVDDTPELATMVIAVPGRAAVRIGDVATIQRGARPRYGAVTQNGQGEVVSGMVLKLQGADSRAVITGVLERFEGIRSAIPSHVRITAYYDQTELVARTTGTIIKNLVGGGLLVIAVLFLFLRNVRASLIVASVIPLSMLFAFIGMWTFGYSANLMSLGALDFGLIVDASVVMVENFIRRLERARPEDDRTALLRDAAIEVARPILFGIAIIVAVYIPIFTLDGMEGRMFKPMAFTVVLAVLGSLLLALTYVPAIAAAVLHHAHEEPSRWFEAVRSRYIRALRWAMDRGTALVIGSVAAILIAVGSLGMIGTEFMPKLDEGSILVNTRRLPSVSLADATRLSTAVEEILMTFPEVTMVVTKEGRPDLATEAMGLYEGDVYVTLRPTKEWTTARDREGLIAAFDSALAVIPGLGIGYTQPLAMRLDESESGIRTDLGIKVVGNDLAVTNRLAEQIERIVARTRGAADVSVEISEGSGELRVEVDREALASHGATVADVQEAIELAMGTRVATELVDGPRRVGIVVRVSDDARRDAESLRRLSFRTAQGALVPVGAVAQLVSTTGPEVIAHEDAQRRTLVMANVRGRDLGSFVEEVRAAVAASVTLPPNVFLEWGGQYENQARAMRRLVLVVPAAIVLIFLLLFATFGSVGQSVLVLTNVPFALVGGVAVLWLRGLNLSLSASVGFIALFGIAVLNGVVLVARINALRDEGRAVDEAIVEGAFDRLRPVLMTALVASLGFIPMALSTSPGAEVQRPLATVVIGGLITSTVLTLFVLPTLYGMLARFEARRAAATLS